MIQNYGLNGAIGINNVGNAFTPQGSCDPLSIASLGVGVYQAGTKADAQVLYDCVSSGAKASIGYPQSESLIGSGASADFVLVGEEHSVYGDQFPSRRRRFLKEVIYNPPVERRIIKGGRTSS